MAGTVKHARLESQSARARLKRGRQPHWQALIEGKVAPRLAVLEGRVRRALASAPLHRQQQIPGSDLGAC
jgi:hypothetical protein